MPANLPIKAKMKWTEVVAARDPREKIRLMQEFLSLVPKHKGTDTLRSHVKRRMTQLLDELEKSETRRRGSQRGYFIQKSGAAQVVILGITKSGRSSLLAAVTKARPRIGDHPFMTRIPVPGMLQYQDIQFQLIEAPAIVEGSSEGKGGGTQVIGLARNADGIILLLDLSNDPVRQFNLISSELEKAQIQTSDPEGEVEVERRASGSHIQFIWNGELQDCTAEDVVKLLREYKIQSASIRIIGKVSLDMIENSLFGGPTFKPTMLVGNKYDLPDSELGLEKLTKALPNTPVLRVSCNEPAGLAATIGEAVFRTLGIIRVYTKEVGQEPTKAPFVTKAGSTIEDLAKMIHSDFLRNFKYARLWGSSSRFPGARVGLTQILHDRDVVEIHV